MKLKQIISKVFFFSFLSMMVLQPQTLVREASTQRDFILRQVLTERAQIFRMTRSREITNAILSYSKTYHIDPYLVTAVMKVESGFNPKAKSYVGAMGLMQLLPIAVRDMPHLKNEISVSDLWNPEKNIHAGVSYLALLHKKFRGDLRLMITAYNAGPTFVARQVRNNNILPEGYYNKVMKAWLEMKPTTIRSARVSLRRNTSS